MIFAVIITGDRCLSCDAGLISLPGQEPWCAACERNLDHFAPSRAYHWFERRSRRTDHAAAFRSGLTLARSGAEPPAGTGRYVALVALSTALMLVMIAAVAGGLWSIDAAFLGLGTLGFGSFLLLFLGGVLLVWFGFLLRPRFGRVKPLLEDRQRLETLHAPALLGLIERIARELDAPRPDLVLAGDGWATSVATAGLRRTKVLVLGLPMLLALRPQELAAAIAHELGHLKYGGGRRALLIGPARRSFGILSKAAERPPRRVRYGPLGFLLVPWELFGGLVAWPLWQLHLAVNALAAGEDRATELRADAATAHLAGTDATLDMLDVLAQEPLLRPEMRLDVPKGEAATAWRRALRPARERATAEAAAWRQLSGRTDASLFAAHPAPGRRHQWLAAQPAEPGLLTVTADEMAGIELQLAPFADFLRRHWIALTL